MKKTEKIAEGQIQINNILWDTENLEVEGKTHFTWDEAIESAKSAGKRLPTINELRALNDLGSTWDAELKGRWFGNDHALKDESREPVPVVL